MSLNRDAYEVELVPRERCWKFRLLLTFIGLPWRANGRKRGFAEDDKLVCFPFFDKELLTVK